MSFIIDLITGRPIFTKNTYTTTGTGVPTSRILTINGVPYDLSQDRSWTIRGQEFKIRSVADLAPYLAGDEYILPSELIEVYGLIDLGDKAIRYSTDTVLRGYAKATFMSSNPNGVVRADNIASAVIGREFNVVATAGPCFLLNGTIDHQLNLFFIGMIGAKAAIINGFDVQGVKSCFVDAADGITFGGITNKVFISECPFYGIGATGSAITLASTLSASVADIVTSFFKFNGPGVGLKAEVGYSVGEGKLRGSLIEGTAIPLSGLAPSDLNWTMTDNTRIGNSKIVGAFNLVTAVETVINAPDTPVKVAGLTVGNSMNERFVASDNRLTYIGRHPATGTFNGNFAVDSGNNVDLVFYLAKNGVILEETFIPLRIGSGSDERTGSITGLIDFTNEDIEQGPPYVEIWVKNLLGTENLTTLSLNLNSYAS